jgi:hypothetical protein
MGVRRGGSARVKSEAAPMAGGWLRRQTRCMQAGHRIGRPSAQVLSPG